MAAQKKTSYSDAVNRARKITDAEDSPAETSLAVLADDEGGAAISTYDPRTLQAMVESGEIELAPALFTLEAGMMITGIVKSFGIAELVDENTKEVKPVRTWQIMLVNPATGAELRMVSILGAAQLNRQIEGGDKDNPKWLGRLVVICRGETKKQPGKARQITEYMVGAYKAAGPSASAS